MLSKTQALDPLSARRETRIDTNLNASSPLDFDQVPKHAKRQLAQQDWIISAHFIAQHHPRARTPIR